MLVHLGGAGGTVYADHVDPERLQRCERGADSVPSSIVPVVSIVTCTTTGTLGPPA